MPGTMFVFANIDDLDRNSDPNAWTIDDDVSIHDMLSHLTKGMDVAVCINRVRIGFRLPEGVDIVFSEACPKNGSLRQQVEARVHLYPSDTGDQTDGIENTEPANLMMIARAGAGKVTFIEVDDPDDDISMGPF